MFDYFLGGNEYFAQICSPRREGGRRRSAAGGKEDAGGAERGEEGRTEVTNVLLDFMSDQGIV